MHSSFSDSIGIYFASLMLCYVSPVVTETPGRPPADDSSPLVGETADGEGCKKLMSTVCFTATAGVAIPLLLGCALLATAERFWSESCLQTKTRAVRRVAPIYKYEGGRDVSSKSLAVTASQVSGCTGREDHSVRWTPATRQADGAQRGAGNHLRHHLVCVAVRSSVCHTRVHFRRGP